MATKTRTARPRRAAKSGAQKTKVRKPEAETVDEAEMKAQTTSQGEELDMPSTKPSVEAEDDFVDEFDEDEFEEDDDDEYDPSDEDDEDDGEHEEPEFVPEPDYPEDSVEAKAQRINGHLTGLIELLDDNAARNVRTVCPGGQLADDMDALLRPAHGALDAFLRKWVNGRP